jgi:thermitase
MTDPLTPATAPSWPLPDPRTAAQRERDKAAVRAQVSVLSTPNSDAQAKQELDRVIERIRLRQTTAVADHATRFLTFAQDGSTRPAMAVENELVIDADDQQIAQLGTALDGYVLAPRPGGPPGRRTRVFRSRTPRTIAQLRADARRIRDRQIPATVNSVVPLGYVIKGNSYPGSTAGPLTFTPSGGDAPVRVAIIDTGLTGETRNDGWFTGAVPGGPESIDPVNVLAPMDRIDWHAGHGTFASGIVKQLAPNCEVVVYRFTATDGLGTDASAAEMLVRAADEGAGKRLIINASFGAPAVDGVPPLAMKEAVQYITQQYPDAMIIASAGNDAGVQPVYPAAFPQPAVKAVGALNADLTGAAFSNRGDWVDCSAVGVGIVSTFVKGKLPPETDLGADISFGTDSWATWSGTSFTAPQISGAVARLCADNASLKPRQAFDQLVAGRPALNHFGTVVHLLPGTPTS